ncbi:hypothetical protein B0H16DRAFT_1612299 [Mycena metata]|uniref:HMG box domain-containing protein n=1 Tax=Mycena metata TaxID=1033252 RepID=A0AAD7HCB4_9AGAR|nr:hypothetical protein B0H16DRAFT_1612299 [Mycena metata]
MPVARTSIPYRQSRRLKQADPSNDLWEPYDENLLRPVALLHSISDPATVSPPAVPILGPLDHIPRPRNAFIFFRSDYVKVQKIAVARPGSLDQTAMSCGAGEAWRKMNEVEREPYILALEEKEAHAIKYPYRYAPGSASGVTRRNRKSNATRTSTASSDASHARLRFPVPEARPSQKYETNPPASRRKCSPVPPQPRPLPSPTPLSATPMLASTLSLPESTLEVTETNPAAYEDICEKVHLVPLSFTLLTHSVVSQLSIDRSPVRPSAYDCRPTHFGFKRDLSPTIIESLTLPPSMPIHSPSTSMSMISPNIEAFLPRAPAPAAAFSSRPPSPGVPPPPPAAEWDGWMYTPLELPDEDELRFDAPAEDFGFYHPWNFGSLETDSACPAVLADSLFMS